MAGMIILISIIFVGYIVFRMTKGKLLKYILTPVLSLLYGFMLFFTGMGVGDVVYLILAALPVIIGLVLIFKKRI